MTVAVVNTWEAHQFTQGTPTGSPAPKPQGRSLVASIAPSAGNWLIALCSWTLPGAAYLGPTVAVADDGKNFWQPLGAPSGTSSAAGFTRVSVWAAPNIRTAPGQLFVSPCSASAPPYLSALGVTIIEVSGLSPWLGIPVVVVSSANAATAISAVASAPSSQALMVAVAASDITTAPSGPGAGWTALTGTVAGTTAPAVLRTTPAWQVTTGAATAAWTSAAADLSACVATILVSNPAPAQPNPNWPFTQLQAGFGAGAQTPPDQIAWTDTTPRFLAGQTCDSTRGKSYQLGQTQAGSTGVGLDNNDAALTPDNSASPYYPNVATDTPLRLLMTWEDHTYPVWSGPVEEWPQAWMPRNRYGYAQAKVTDAWSLLGGSLSALQQQEILADSPYAYWTAGDAAGAAYAGNSAPGNTQPLQVVTSKSGALGATYAFGADSGANPGDPSGTVYSQTGLTAGQQGYGYCLTCTDHNLPALTTPGITLMGWFKPAGTTQVSADLILMRATSAPGGPVIQAHLNNPTGAAPGGITLQWWNQPARNIAPIVNVSVTNWLTAGWFHIALQVSSTGWAVYLNGALSSSGAATLPATIDWLTFLGCADRYATTGMLNGEARDLAVFGQPVPDDRIASIFLAGCPTPLVTPSGSTTVAAAQFAGEVPSDRIERLTAYGGWAGPRAISPASPLPLVAVTDISSGSSGTSVSGSAVSSGKNAAQAVADIVTTAGGVMFAGGDGVLRNIAREDLYPLGPVWALGELGASTLSQNPDFAGGSLANWSGFQCAITESQAQVYMWPWSCLITPNGVSSGCDLIGTNAQAFPVTPGAAYRAAAWVYSPNGWGNVAPGLDWHDSTGTYLSTSTQQFNVVPGSWTFLRTAPLTAPGGAVTGVVRIGENGTPPSSALLYVQHLRALPGAPEIPVLDDVAFSQDKQQFYDQAQLTQATGSGVAVTASDDAAASQHGPSLFSATVYQQSLDAVGDEANWIVSTRSALANRARKATVDAGKNPDLMEFVLSAEPGTPVQVTRRPITASQPTTAQAVIAQITRHIDWGVGLLSAEVTTDIFPEGAVLTAGDPLRGQLTGANLLAL